MSRRCFALTAVLALSLKALMPTGFMLASVDDHAQLVLCPAGIHFHGMAMSMDHADAMSMQHAPGIAHAAHAAHAATSADACPFAQAAGSALPMHAVHVYEPYFTMLRPLASASSTTTDKPSDAA